MGFLQFWSQEVSGFLITYSKVSVCFSLFRRRFKDGRLIKNDDVCPFCFWLSLSQSFQENSFCLCYELNFLGSVLPRGHDITWELLIGRCLLPSAAQNRLERVACEMWKKNENNILFAVLEGKREKNPQSIAELSHNFFSFYLLCKDQSRGRILREVCFDEFGWKSKPGFTGEIQMQNTMCHGFAEYV